MSDYIDNVLHLKKKLEKGVSYEKTLHILHKLQKIPITIDLLQTTGIGKTVRQLTKKQDNDISKTAKLLCITWKQIVKQQQDSEDGSSDHYMSNNSSVTQNNTNSSPVPQQLEDYSTDNHINTNDKSKKKSSHKTKTEQNISNELNSDKKYKSNSNEKTKKRDYNNEDNERINSEKKHSKSHKKHKSSHRRDSSDYNEFNDSLFFSNDSDANKKSINKSEISSSSTSNKHKTQSNSTNLTNDYRSADSIKKSDTKPQVKSAASHSTSTSVKYPTALERSDVLKSLDKMDILSSLPNPNYKPLPNREFVDERVEANRRNTRPMAEDLSVRVQSKKGRTAVFAGHAKTSLTRVYKLEELCIRVLMDNIDKIEYIGDTPYYLIKPVLQKCNPKQLFKIERYNPDLIDETDELWKDICNNEFKNKEPDEDEDESWRELYWRSVKERENKLKNLTASIVARKEKALPVRTTKRAFTDEKATPKPPREVQRKQERIANNRNSASTINTANCVKIVPEKPKVAPLMKKALMMQKMRFRR